MTYSAYLLPPDARPTAQDYAGLSGPDIIWEDERWWRFTEHTDLHEVRYLEVRQDDRAVALAPLLITPKPGGLLFYDRPDWPERPARWPSPTCSTQPTNSAGPS
jgi:uncharacterized protein